MIELHFYLGFFYISFTTELITAMPKSPPMLDLKRWQDYVNRHGDGEDRKDRWRSGNFVVAGN